ncbi:MAG: IS1 family transposase [Klebsiella sp.]|nr:IS1 family transposase [Klebsiella sp.]
MASVSVCCPSCSATEGVMRNGKVLDAGQPPALWALASTRFYVT